jgi:Pectinacetylesterase
MTFDRRAAGPAARSLCRMKRLLAVLTALVVLLTGCRSLPPLEWQRVTPAGNCHCADGSPFGFWERRADPARVVFFLNGGGVCWDARSCAFTGERGESDFYDWGNDAATPENRSGMFDTTRSDNPFAAYSYLYVSACTGDAHLGDATRKYSSELTVEHRGYANGTAALDYLAEHYPHATEVVVVGKTAGSVAAPVYGALVADRLPGAKVTVFGAQSGAWPDNPALTTEVLQAQWGTAGALPGWAARAGTVPRFWVEAGRHNPALVLARFDFAYDPKAASEVTRWMDGDPPDLLATIDRNEAAIEAAGVLLHSYTAPGADHQIFEPDKFYELEVNGVRLTDWLGKVVAHQSPADVHCDTCD